MGAKIKNHTVTRGYLAGWKHVDAKGSVGIWYFDIASGEVRLSPSVNASFAIAKAIYAPKINGRRDDRLENWFSSSETELCDFVRDYRRASPRRWKPKAVYKALSGIISLGYRGEYALRIVEQHLAAGMPAATKEEVTLAALNNLFTTAQDRIEFFLKGTALLLEWDEPMFATNDTPFWDLTPISPAEPIGLFPLSPSRLMVFLPNQLRTPGQFRIIHRKGAEFQVAADFARDAAMRMARKWVVCSSEEEANRVKEYLTRELLDEVFATDRLRFIEVAKEHLIFDI